MPCYLGSENVSWLYLATTLLNKKAIKIHVPPFTPMPTFPGHAARKLYTYTYTCTYHTHLCIYHSNTERETPLPMPKAQPPPKYRSHRIHTARTNATIHTRPQVVTAVSCGVNHTMIIDNSGKLFACGSPKCVNI